ncbi:MAG: RnfABCDGE type electron transport complex subunit A [Candidatus Omnitrophota bacterium]
MIYQILAVIIGAIFVKNFVLTRFLGLCSFIGISQEMKSSFPLGIAVIFVSTCASTITWCIYRYLLLPFNIEFLRTISFILVIASFVQLVEMVILKTSPALYRALGIYLPLITVNCAVMGVAVLNSEEMFLAGRPIHGSFVLSLVQGFCVGVGYMLAISLMAGMRERLAMANIPRSLRGAPIAFIIASLMSMSFMGFLGFKFF